MHEVAAKPVSPLKKCETSNSAHDDDDDDDDNDDSDRREYEALRGGPSPAPAILKKDDDWVLPRYEEIA